MQTEVVKNNKEQKLDLSDEESKDLDVDEGCFSSEKKPKSID